MPTNGALDFRIVEVLFFYREKTSPWVSLSWTHGFSKSMKGTWWIMESHRSKWEWDTCKGGRGQSEPRKLQMRLQMFGLIEKYDVWKWIKDGGCAHNKRQP